LNNSEIEYPCKWSFKIIGSDKELIMETIENLLVDLDFQMNESRQSKTGKYSSLHVSIRVASQEERDRLFQLFQNIPTVKIVL
jgi:uncharacterized protein